MLKNLVACVVLLHSAVCSPLGAISVLDRIPESFYKKINNVAKKTDDAMLISHTNGICATQQCKAVIWKQAWLDKFKSVTVSCMTIGDHYGGYIDQRSTTFVSPQNFFVGFEGMRYCVKRKEAEKRKRNRQKNNGVVTMEKVDADYNDTVKRQFDEFIIRYKRQYGWSANPDKYIKRFKIFKQNLEVVKSLNQIGDGAVYGINQFMDYSDEEYRKYLAPGITKPLFPIRNADLSDLETDVIPESVDWRKKGAVTRVKNQGFCGSCWAYSTTGNVEGQWFLKHGKLYSLSEQQLVDCDHFDYRCKGGLPYNAYESIMELGGLETEKDYPSHQYLIFKRKCHVNESKFKVYVNSSVMLPTDEAQLAAWLAKNGPISIAINANMMMFYLRGIAHPRKFLCNPKHLDHAVLLVGYGTEHGIPYWIIKNSWGAFWGEKGYYRIYRGDGSCGLNLAATSAVIY